MRLRHCRPGVGTFFVIALTFLLTSNFLFATPAPAQAQQVQTGVSQTIRGVTVTLEELRSRAAQPSPPKPREASPRRTFNGLPVPPPSIPTATGVQNSPSPQPDGSQKLPQALVDEILGPAVTDTLDFVPPDTMGAVGSIDFLFSVNTHLRAFTKAAPHTQVFDFDEQTFWGSFADPSGVSDTHVRYDPTTQRWFIVEIDVKSTDNHILLAVSSSADLSSASWHQYQLASTGTGAGQDQGCFNDYPTPGIDQNAIYIGGNIFGGGVATCTNANYKHSNLYVIQKAPTLSGASTTLTSFFNVAGGVFGIATIQGVDSYYDGLTTGYAIAVKETENPRAHLNVWQINNPGSGSPTLSGPTAVAVSSENGALGGVLTANNVASSQPTHTMDDIDDRLFAAVIRSGHLWTAHNVAVDSTGNSNGGTRNREGVRWYDLTVSGLTLNQSGTVFDGASSGFLNYWMGTVMPSGQGHVAMGLNRANSTTAVQAGALGRLSGDTSGTMRTFSMFQNSVNPVGGAAWPYSDFGGGPVNRWGDYTYTSLDPCDDMTLWTTQEFIAGATNLFGFVNDWQVAAEKLQAPAPAVLPGGPVATIQTGLASTTLNLTGTSPNGEGFYDTPNTVDPTCRTRLKGSVTNGVVVSSVTFTDPTHITLTLNTTAATAGTATVTITNPDGQTVTTSITLANPTNTPTDTPTQTPTSTPTNTATNIFTSTSTNTSTNTPTTTPTNTPTNTSTNTPTNTATATNTSTSTTTNTPTATPTATFTPTNTPTNTATNTPTITPTNTNTPTATPTNTPVIGRFDTIGVFRTGTFFLRLHNSTGFADITVGFGPGTKPYPVVGDWTGAGFDTVGTYDQSNGLFTVCTANNTTTCANNANWFQFVLGNPNDQPLSGRWNAGFTHFGGGVFRPSNGLIYLKNNLTTGVADYTMVLGIPGDQGLTGDWNGDGLDSPGVYRPSTQHFYLNDQVCNCSEYGTYAFQYGVAGDSPVTGDWIGQGHDGVGLFRQSNGFTYLRNELTTGFADITFVYGIAGDIPIAGHWQLVYPPKPNPVNTFVPPTLAPLPTPGGPSDGPGD